MEKLTFEDLPQAVQLIMDKLDKLETLIIGQQHLKPESNESLDITGASALLGLAQATVYSKVCRGEIPAFKLGRKLLFDRKELEGYLDTAKEQTSFHLKKMADEKLAGRIKKRIYTY